MKRLHTGLPGVTPHLPRKSSSNESFTTVSTEDQSAESPAAQTETEEETDDKDGKIDVEGVSALTEEAVETHTPDIVTGFG